MVETITFTTAAARTISATDLAQRVHIRDPNGAARADTLPSAGSTIDYLLPYIGAQCEILYNNSGEAAETITITAGANTTLYNNEGSADLVIAAGDSARLVFIRNSNTTMIVLGTIFEAV